MKFLVDECTGPTVAKWLKSRGYEVFSVFDDARGVSDIAILEKAYIEEWIIITNDKDFGEMVYKENNNYSGYLRLRIAPRLKIGAIEIKPTEGARNDVR